ncbi:MAG: hypothetical protein GY874_15900 [Desulfobacteraceae bacterium]|nr:hypothetical protein [Desulfobacteraceae bacterium]
MVFAATNTFKAGNSVVASFKLSDRIKETKQNMAALAQVIDNFENGTMQFLNPDEYKNIPSILQSQEVNPIFENTKINGPDYHINDAQGSVDDYNENRYNKSKMNRLFESKKYILYSNLCIHLNKSFENRYNLAQTKINTDIKTIANPAKSNYNKKLLLDAGCSLYKSCRAFVGVTSPEIAVIQAGGTIARTALDSNNKAKMQSFFNQLSWLGNNCTWIVANPKAVGDYSVWSHLPESTGITEQSQQAGLKDHKQPYINPKDIETGIKLGCSSQDLAALSKIPEKDIINYCKNNNIVTTDKHMFHTWTPSYLNIDKDRSELIWNWFHGEPIEQGKKPDLKNPPFIGGRITRNFWLKLKNKQTYDQLAIQIKEQAGLQLDQASAVADLVRNLPEPMIKADIDMLKTIFKSKRPVNIIKKTNAAIDLIDNMLKNSNSAPIKLENAKRSLEGLKLKILNKANTMKENGITNRVKIHYVIKTERNQIENIIEKICKVDSNCVDNDTNSMLHMACMTKNKLMITEILFKNINSYNKCLGRQINSNGQSPLDLVMQMKDETCLDAFIDFESENFGEENIVCDRLFKRAMINKFDFKDYQGAINDCIKIKNNFPGFYAVLPEYADLLLKTGDYKNAIAACNEALGAMPASSLNLRYSSKSLALIYSTKAIALKESAKAFAAKKINGPRAKINFYNNCAIDNYYRALQYTSNKLKKVSYLIEIGDIFMEKKNYDQAIQNFRTAIKFDLTSSYSYISIIKLSEAYWAKEDYKSAIDVCNSGIQKIGVRTPPLYSTLANIYLKTGNYLNAINVCKKALNNTSDNAAYYCQLANIYKEMDHIGMALENYATAFAMDPDNVEARNGLESLKEKLNLKAAELKINDPDDNGNYEKVTNLIKMIYELLDSSAKNKNC